VAERHHPDVPALAPEETTADASARPDGGFGELLSPEQADPAGEGDAVAGTAARAGWASRWGRVFRNNRALWTVAAIAVVSLVAGLLVGRFVVSPAEAAARADPPEPGLITVPVEFGELSNDVTIRGEVGYADAVEVTLDTSSLSGPAIVTGRVPEAGTELGPLSIALEVAGRPVIVLPGELPAYRTIRFGMSGPDVVQFKQAMAAVGIDAGDPASDVFDAAAAAAVTALYERSGYAAPEAAEGSAEGVRAASEGVTAAQQALVAANEELGRAGAGASAVALREADNQIASAQRQLDAARAADPVDPLVVADMEDALALAKLRREEVAAPPDTRGQRAAVDAARAQLSQAQESLTRAREEAMPFLPAGEVLYLGALPRRVDAVTAARGSILQGAAMTVSGATLELTGSAAEADATLLQVGGEASFELPDGSAHRAIIAELAPAEDSEGRWTIGFTPDPMTPEQIQQLQGANVRVSIPVGATEGDVLFVPLAAVTAGPGGESRVEVVDGDPRDGDSAETRLVDVETGLAAEGSVEIRPVDTGDLEAGDLVVVGR
jgi:hypothetical protein